ncbi:MAG: selenocysteine synthase [Cyclobacteriaceae bacterium]
MKRRKLLKLLPGISVGGGLLIGGRSAAAGDAAPNHRGKPRSSIYESIGVRPLINARGTVTIVGATRVLPEVREAMEAAVREYVQLDELMEGVGRRLAELTGAEWGCVTSGASAAITAATAGCVTMGDPDKMWQLPDLGGLRDEVIIPRYSRSAYDAAARAVGVRMIEVNSREELGAAMGPRTAMVLVLAGSRSADGPLSLSEISSVARPLRIPVLVDAAAEELRVPNPHLSQGADMVVYSGGKCLRGPQCAGLLLGRKDLVSASWISSAPHHGFGRGYKVGREEIMGMLTAVEMWMKRDHTAEQKTWTSWAEYIALHLKSIPGVRTEITQPRGLSNHFPSLSVEWDTSAIPLTGQEVEQLLWEGNPRIAVGGAGSFLPFPPNEQPNISINTSQLEEGEEKIIAERVHAVLLHPTSKAKITTPAALDISGQWDVEMKFSASVVKQRLVFEQKNNELTGTHITDFVARDFIGTLHGNDILIRSSYTGQGMRLNFTFTGKINNEVIEGEVNMGEYGMAQWKAKRHVP